MVLLNSVRIFRPIQLLNISLFSPSSLKTGYSRNFDNSKNLIRKLNNIEKINEKPLKFFVNNPTSEFIKINKKIYASHRVKPFEIEIWKSKKTINDKELIIFMPGLGGEINNFKWIGSELTKRGWPIVFIDHRGSNLKAFKEILEGKEAIPGSADYLLYRIKVRCDTDPSLKACHNKL